MDFLTFIAILVVGAPIAKAVASRISGRGAGTTGAEAKKLREALEHTEQRLEDAEQRVMDTSDRLAEVEERLDFTERLLTELKTRQQLGSGGL